MNNTIDWNKKISIKRKESLFIVIPMIFTLSLELLKVSNFATDAVCLTAYIAMIIWLYIKNPYIIIKYASFILGSTWAIIAVFCLENLSVIVANDSSFRYGSFSIYVFSWIIYYYVICRLEDKNIKRTYVVNEYRKKNRLNTICWIVAAATSIEFIAFMSVIRNPYYLVATDRVSYAANYLPSWLNGHIGFFVIIIPLAVMIFEKRKVLSLLYISLYFLIELWVGEKFTGLFLGIYVFALSFVLLYKDLISRKFMRNILSIIGISAVLLIIGVFFQMQIVSGRNFSFYFLERISAQGYLWWLTYAKDSMNGWHISEIADEITPFITRLNGDLNSYNFGIYKLMHLFQDSVRVRTMLTEGFRATESTRATFYYYFKIPGLIVGQIGLSLMTFKIINYMMKQICKYNYIQVIFICYILRNFIAIHSMSDFYLLLSPTMCFSYLILLFGDNLNFSIKNAFPKISLRKK